MIERPVGPTWGFFVGGPLNGFAEKFPQIGNEKFTIYDRANPANVIAVYDRTDEIDQDGRVVYRLRAKDEPNRIKWREFL